MSITEKTGVVATFDAATGKGSVEVPEDFATYSFSTRCYYAHGLISTPERGEKVMVLFSPTPTQLLSVREIK